MPMHRSIIRRRRTRRTVSNDRGLYYLSFIVGYLLLNLMFHKYWLIIVTINGITFCFISGICVIVCFHSENENVGNNQIVEAEIIEYGFNDDFNYDDIIVAVPINE